MAEQLPEHMPGLKLIHKSQHMPDMEHVKTHANKIIKTQFGTFPSLMAGDVPEHKPDLMPERASEHHINPHKTPLRAGITRSISKYPRCYRLFLDFDSFLVFYICLLGNYSCILCAIHSYSQFYLANITTFYLEYIFDILWQVPVLELAVAVRQRPLRFCACCCGPVVPAHCDLVLACC